MQIRAKNEFSNEKEKSARSESQGIERSYISWHFRCWYQDLVRQNIRCSSFKLESPFKSRIFATLACTLVGVYDKALSDCIKVQNVEMSKKELLWISSLSSYELESVNVFFLWSRSQEELYSPIKETPEEPKDLVQELGPPNRPFINIAGRDSFIALWRYVPETEVLVLSLFNSKAWFTTTFPCLSFKRAGVVSITKNLRNICLSSSQVWGRDGIKWSKSDISAFLLRISCLEAESFV